jgi:hypothetical protein
MATSYSHSGSLTLKAFLKATASGDQTGSHTAEIDELLTFALSGGDTTMIGFIKGATVTCAAGDWLLAHATDPFQSMGDAAYSPGFTVAGSKLKLIIIINTDAANSITVARKASTGLPIFNADGDAITIGPGGFECRYIPGGTAALSTGVNDALAISVSAGSPTCTVLLGYGA